MQLRRRILARHVNQILLISRTRHGMSKAAQKSSPLLGQWRITEMPDFDEEYLDGESPAFIQFNRDSGGEFHFGYVHGCMDCRPAERDGKPAIEWSWDGNDEHHQAQGRGWAVLASDGKLEGRIYFHEGDDYLFRAEKQPGGKSRQAK